MYEGNTNGNTFPSAFFIHSCFVTKNFKVDACQKGKENFQIQQCLAFYSKAERKSSGYDKFFKKGA